MSRPLSQITRLIFIKLYLAMGLILLSGCQSIDSRGLYVSNAQIDKINSTKPTRLEIVRELGTPNFVPEYQEQHWYYLQRSLANQAWFKPKVVSQRVVRVTFEQDIAVKAELIENSQQALALYSGYTKSRGVKRSGVQKFVGNIGRFSKSAKNKTNRKPKN